MHCMAGDGVGILVGAVIASVMMLMGLVDVALEYVLGFGFGWTIFQALFMRSEAGGSYKAALRNTFIPELLSMNALMAGMVPTMMLAMRYVQGSHDPTQPAFWFVMSMALLVGFVTAYPMNWWLVTRHLKHGMMTMRTPESGDTMMMQGSGPGDMAQRQASGHAQHGTSAVMNTVMGHESVESKAMEQGMGENVSSGALAGMALVSLAPFAAGLGIAYYFGGFG